MNRPTVEDALKIVKARDGDGVGTQEIILALQEQGFDVDKAFFWSDLAPGLVEATDQTVERKQ